MTRFLLLLSSICSLLVLSWCLGRWYGPQNCINSTLVGKVVIYPGSISTKQCEPLIRLLDPMPDQIIINTKLIRRIESLEAVGEYLDHSEKPLTINILSHAEHEFSIDQQKIQISLDLVNKEDVLERAILFAKLNSGNPISAAVAADFLMAQIINNHFVSIDKMWLAHLKTLKSYCRSNSIMLLHMGFCEAHNELNDSYITELDSSAVPWSFVPLYTQILKDIYQQADMLQKKSMLQNIIFLGDPDDSFIESQNYSRELLSRDASFLKMIKEWVMPLSLPDELIEGVVSKYKIKNDKVENYVIVGRSSRDLFSSEFLDSSEGRMRERLIFQVGSMKYFFPSDVGHNFTTNDVFKSMPIQNVIYVSCNIPEVESLLEYEPFTKRIIYLKQCEADDINWPVLARLGLSEYLKTHTHLQFVEFNLSALRLAKRVRGPLRDTTNFLAWQKWLLWQKTISDDGFEIKRPLAAIDGVGRFRY